jgi:uncharacterized protein DUF3551
MRASLAFALTVLFVLLAPIGEAAAQNFPWCAQYSIRGGARNCGFVSWDQCMATIRGIGGFCERNYMFRPGDVRPARRKVRRRY